MNVQEKSITRRLVAFPLLSAAFLTLIGFWGIDTYLARAAIARYEKNLIVLARCGANTLTLLLENGNPEAYGRIVNAFVSNSQLRVSIIDFSGKVLGDSRLTVADVERLEDHSNRPEIVQARELGAGVSIRHSTTLDMDFMYAAVRYGDADYKGYFRIALPMAELVKEHILRRQGLAGGCFLAFVVIAALSMLVSRYLLSLLNRQKQDLEQRIDQISGQMDMLKSFISQLATCSSIEELIQVVDPVATTLLPQFKGALAVIRSSRDKVEVVGSWNGPWTGEPLYLLNQCWALRTGKLHISDAGAGAVACEHFPDHEGKTVCLPLASHGETHGVLHFSGPRGGEWSPTERQFASAIAEHVSLAIANIRLRETLTYQAFSDSLTGLRNRRYLFESMEAELNRAARHGQKVGALMIDIDLFKKFNDKYGHDIGDFILSEFGRLLKMILRKEDLPCRYGGEEFVVLLPETDDEGIAQAAMKVVAAVRNHDFVCNKRSYAPITISIGVARFPDHGKTVQDILKQADNALYEAKKNGRDRVAFV